MKPIFKAKQLTADPNYHSLNSLKVCKDEKIDAYIPDIQFRKRDPRFADQERFKDGVHGRQRPDAKPRLFTRLTSLSIRTNRCIDVRMEKN